MMADESRDNMTVVADGGANIVLYDTFTDVQGTLLSAHTPEVGSWGVPGLTNFINTNTLKGTTNQDATGAQLSGTDFELLLEGIDASAASNWFFRFGIVALSTDGFLSANNMYCRLGKDNYVISRSNVSLATGNMAVSWGSNFASEETLVRMKRVGSDITLTCKKDNATASEADITHTLAPGVATAFPYLRGTIAQLFSSIKYSDNPSATEWLL